MAENKNFGANKATIIQLELALYKLDSVTSKNKKASLALERIVSYAQDLTASQRQKNPAKFFYTLFYIYLKGEELKGLKNKYGLYVQNLMTIMFDNSSPDAYKRKAIEKQMKTF